MNLSISLGPIFHLQNPLENRFWDSQNCWYYKGPLEVIWSHFLFKNLKPTTQESAQMVFEYLQKWRLHNLSGLSVPGLRYYHSRKKSLQIFLRKRVCFPLYPSPSVLLLGTTQKVLTLSSLHVFIYINKSSSQAFSSGWTVLEISAFIHRRDAPVP